MQNTTLALQNLNSTTQTNKRNGFLKKIKPVSFKLKFEMTPLELGDLTSEIEKDLFG
jgi:hypothetical protein